MSFRELNEEEIKDFLPELSLQEGEEVMAYSAVDQEGNHLCSAVFIPSAFRKDEAVLCRLEVRPEGEEIANNFFDSCVKMMQKKKKYESVYFRSTGSEEEVMGRYDLLVSLGFRPTLCLGHRYSLSAEELFNTKFAKDFTPPEKGDSKLFCLQDLKDPEAIRFLKVPQISDIYLQNRLYAPEYSFLYLKNPESGGIMCSNVSDDLLSITVTILKCESERGAMELFYKLLGALIDSASKTFSPDGRVVLFFNQPYCHEFLKERLHEGAELFQEFLWKQS